LRVVQRHHDARTAAPAPADGAVVGRHRRLRATRRADDRAARDRRRTSGRDHPDARRGRPAPADDRSAADDHQAAARARLQAGHRAAAAGGRPAGARAAAAAEPQRRLSTQRGPGPLIVSGGAGAARAAEHDLVLGDVHSEALADALDRALEAGVAERLEATAAVADDVVVVLGCAARGLETRGSLTDLDAIDQPDPLELLHHAVDARARGLTTAALERLLDLHGRER